MSIEGWQGQIHPAAELFPLMEGEEFEGLVASIKEQGLRESIWVTADGQLLDGRNRVRACHAAGIQPTRRTFTGDDPVAFVVALNLVRRHLNETQLSLVGLNVIALYEAEALQRKAAAGAKAAPNRPSQDKDGASGHHVSQRGPRATDLAAKTVGVSGRSMARAKRISENAPDLIPKLWSGELTLVPAEKQVARRLKDKSEQQAREITMAEVPSDAAGTNWRMFHGDFRDRLADLPDGSVDLIITDPPYPAEFMHLWSHLSEQSRRVLKPQGILVALTGAIMLPEVMSKLGEHLQWGWMYVQPLPGANSRIMGRHVLQAYKPWLAYSVGPWPSGSIDWHPDMLDASSRAKDRYRWEQDPNPTKMLIDALSPAGGTVLDPFTGTGSYGIAALQMGRKFIGVESDAERFQKASERLAGHE